MKKTDWKIIITAIAFTYLFYQQCAGINYLIFSFLVIGFLLIGSVDRLKKTSVIIGLLGTFISALFIFVYGTNLPIISFYISFGIFIGQLFEPKSSLLIALFHSFASIILSIPNFLLSCFQQSQERDESSKSSFSKFALLLIPIGITFTFILLYRAANPNFLELTNSIHFDWLSLPLLRFLIFGLVVSFGIFSHYTIRSLKEKDLSLTDELKAQTEEQHSEGLIGRNLSIESELFIGAALLIMLNILIGIVNGVDIVKLWPNPVLPKNQVSYSEYLHSGVQMLILSIILAIAIILFFFRGYFNFLKEAKWLKILGYIWIAQNILLLISTGIRNSIYVEAYGLSHKRIGVFIYLLLAAIGLIITAYKLVKNKNIAFLFRKNSWAFYSVLLFSVCINWDKTVSDYNIQRAINQDQKVDLEYLYRLSHGNLASLVKYMNSEENLKNQNTDDYNLIYLKLENAKNEYKKLDWQSTCYLKEQLSNLELNNFKKD